MTSIWLRRERSGRGPTPEHDRAAIAAAGIALADAGGLAAVSMRKLAADLGTGAASLYRYVENRDELLELMADAAVGELDLTGRAPARGAGTDWRADLLALGRELRGHYHRHPWLLDLVPGLGPNGVRYLEHGLALLAGVDRPGTVKLEALALLTGVVGLVVRQERGGGAGWQTRQAEVLLAAVTGGGFPHLAAAVGADPAPAGDLLDRILPRVLAGVLEA